MILKKSSDALIAGIVSLVNAIMSRRRPGTAAEITLFGPRADRISASNLGYDSISHAFSAFGVCL
jgi:hypothetical protein